MLKIPKKYCNTEKHLRALLHKMFFGEYQK